MSMIRTYTETFDMNTEKDCPTLIGIHTPIGTTPYRFLSPAFRMYKKFKYLGCDITIVNSARLPVDPEQVGKISGTNYVDPRDVLNPILFRGCHGESMASILDSMYNGLLTTNGFHTATVDKETFASTLQNFYYTALGDDSWRKSPIQKTLSIRGLHPLVYQVALPHQLLPTNGLEFQNYRSNNPEAVTNPPGLGNTQGSENGQDMPPGTGWPPIGIHGPTKVEDPYTREYSFVQGINPAFTNKMSRLGWMDTLQYIGQNVPADSEGTFTREMIAQLPKLFMGICLLPPANLCRQYLRVIIRHKFKFAQFRSITTGAIDEQDWIHSATYGYANLYTGNETKYLPDQMSDPPMSPTPEELDCEPMEDDQVD